MWQVWLAGCSFGLVFGIVLGIIITAFALSDRQVFPWER